MQKHLIVAGRCYGKTYKAIELVKSLKETYDKLNVLVVTTVYAQCQPFIEEVVKHYIGKYNAKYDTRSRSCISIEFPCGTTYRFATTEYPEMIRGGLYDAVICEDINLWTDNAIVGYQMSLFATKDNGLFVVTSEDKFSALLDDIFCDKDFHMDTPAGRMGLSDGFQQELLRTYTKDAAFENK